MKTFCLKQAGYADDILIEALVLLLASGGDPVRGQLLLPRRVEEETASAIRRDP